MIRILANDGIDAAGKKLFEAAGIEVVTAKVPQDQLVQELGKYDAILVRSATTVRKDLIDATPSLKVIGRAGVGMDNIDVQYARDKGIQVINTPAASSQSVAELVIAHLFTGVRMLHDANRNMPSSDSKETFDKLKKQYSAGIELSGKTLGIIGAGQIGKSVAALAMGLGMKVLFHRKGEELVDVEMHFHPSLKLASVLHAFRPVSLETLLSEADFITLHVPFPKGSAPILSKNEFAKMKKGAGVVNTARGGVVSEIDLVEALNSGQLGFAGIDVFEGEPIIKQELRTHPKVSLTPHIGGSTAEAQERIGIELAEKVINALK